MKKYLFPATLLLIVVILAACKQKTDYTAFAQCLKDRGAVEYGAFWCPNCGHQAKLFNKKSEELPFYVECDPRGENEQSALCLAKKIEGYPTWEFQDGSRMVGVTQLTALAAKTACELPSNDAAN